MKKNMDRLYILIAALFFITACSSSLPPAALPRLTLTTRALRTLNLTITPVDTAQPAVTPGPTYTPSLVMPPEPEGCQPPPDDYTLVEINGQKLNRRTLFMLEYARTLYRGDLEIDGYAITQGSYTQSVAESFGTHSGGGAVDLSVMRKGTYTVLWDEIPPLIHALRVAGFAAWLRRIDELYDGSPIHIHAIAIGDRQLSTAAIEQLTGPAGYFKGFNGIPVKYGKPIADTDGPPVLCNWMHTLGYDKK